MAAFRLRIHDYALISAFHHGLRGEKANWYAYKLLQDLSGLIEENGERCNEPNHYHGGLASDSSCSSPFTSAEIQIPECPVE